jgi:glycosyltransferase involved in cell wall biosynthesis
MKSPSSRSAPSVLLCAVQAPFVLGGAEILVGELRQNLLRRGFRVDVVNVPFHGHPPSELVRQALTWRLLEVKEPTGEAIDLVIATKFPSYLVRHPRKVTWLFHQHREAYDLFGGPYGSLTDSGDDRQVREAIRTMDETALGECRSLFTISRNVADRLRRFNGLPGVPLYPPPQQVGRYRTDAYGDFLFYAGRLERLKRLDLALEALARTKCGARLKIAGAGPLRDDLEKQAHRLGVEDRVEFLGFVSAEDLLTLYGSCRAAYYTPVDEDYGYVTVEAFLSRKPVVTTKDAGGPLEFVTDAETGWVVPPEPAAVAEAIDRLWALPEARLRAMGEAAHARVAHIHWDHVIDRLTEGLS